MDAREQRGLVIAALCKLNKKDGVWHVPSQSDANRTYCVDPKAGSCTCPDCRENGDGHVCKHQWAVRFVLKRETKSDGTVVETKSIEFVEKKTYTQDWPSYNVAQDIEKERVQELLADLVQGVSEPTREESRRGRKPHSVQNSLFAMVYKVYTLMSTPGLEPIFAKRGRKATSRTAFPQ